VTIDEILNYCEVKECRVSAGGPEVGFVHFDGSGQLTGSQTYVRFNMLNEIAHAASPRKAVEEATVFVVEREGNRETFSREEFQLELERFQALVAV